MVDSMNLYINKMAALVREKCETDLGILKNDRDITVEKMEQIVSFFGGTLVNDDDLQEEACYEKTDSGFLISYRGTYDVLKIAHELGHAFLEPPTTLSRRIMSCNDKGLYEIYASIFARAFVMEDAVFRADVTNQSFQGACDVQKLADLYSGIDDLSVVERGRELCLWP